MRLPAIFCDFLRYPIIKLYIYQKMYVFFTVTNKKIKKWKTDHYALKSFLQKKK